MPVEANADAPDLKGAVDIEQNLLNQQFLELQAALMAWQSVALMALLELGEPVVLTEEFVERVMTGEIEVKADRDDDEKTITYQARLAPEEPEESEEVEVSDDEESEVESVEVEESDASDEE